MLETVPEVLGARDPVMSGDQCWVAKTDEELDDLQTAIRGTLTDWIVRFQVEDNRNGDASQVSKLAKLFDDDGNDEEDGD